MHPRDADDLDFDDENEAHLAQHSITRIEVAEVFEDQPVFVPNKKGLAATWLMLGDTDAGRALTVAVVVIETFRRLRPITGWTSTPGELTRWRQGRR